MNDPAARAWQHAVRLLAVHDRSEREVRDRLATAGTAPAIVDTTIQRLRDLRYLDEQRLALGAAEHAVRRGFGSEYVRTHLTMRGLPEALVEEAATLSSNAETDRARHALGRRYPGELQGPAERAKAARFLLRRGFPEAVVLAIVGEGC